jgi:hypothetical protein
MRQKADTAQQSLFAVTGEKGFDMNQIGSGAVFSACRRYRYLLYRRWSRAPQMVICGINPANADEQENDHTVTRGMFYARREGCGAVYFVNPAALVTPDIRVMRSHPHPIELPTEPGRCDRAILEACERAQFFVAAWGDHGSFRNRDREVLQIVRGKCRVVCFGTTKKGFPLHPSRLANDVPLVEYTGRSDEHA